LLQANQELPPDAISVLTASISRRYEFLDIETALEELLDAIQASSIKEEARNNTNTEDMREMVRWYNQVKNKKSK
jgi:hypothetical protein